MYVIGLTGGIGSGKTRVADEFSRLGAGIVDADIIAREVVEPGSVGLAKIKQHFGSQVISEDGQLNRLQLREIVFADEAERLWLNELLHPLIRAEMVRQCQEQSTPYTLLVVPLLVENNLQRLCNQILVVDVPVSVQIARTRQRDMVSKEQVDSIIKSQASRWKRIRNADRVLNNNRNWSETANEVLQLHQHYLKFATQNKNLVESTTNHV